MGNRESALVTIVSLVADARASCCGCIGQVTSAPADPRRQLRARRLLFLLEAAGAGGDGAGRAALGPLRRGGEYRAAEYYALLLFATSRMLFMASGYTLLTIWISSRRWRSRATCWPATSSASGEVERGGPQVLHPRRAVLGRPALRHLAALRRGRHRAARRALRRRSRDAQGKPLVPLGLAAAGGGSASSRSPPCRSTSGRRTSTWARRRR